MTPSGISPPCSIPYRCKACGSLLFHSGQLQSTSPQHSTTRIKLAEKGEQFLRPANPPRSKTPTQPLQSPTRTTSASNASAEMAEYLDTTCWNKSAGTTSENKG
ncbi:unnamed protein product [Soboliphyme baturini]|uniref:C2H2-type domain-containing protein n=1 Tax=Soboliphyme baturini TaxID=241478 RepID=A0A183IJ67_9BILA|nr:unnamed protein product [Soboliphyme baturini]